MSHCPSQPNPAHPGCDTYRRVSPIGTETEYVAMLVHFPGALDSCAVACPTPTSRLAPTAPAQSRSISGYLQIRGLRERLVDAQQRALRCVGLVRHHSIDG